MSWRRSRTGSRTLVGSARRRCVARPNGAKISDWRVWSRPTRCGRCSTGRTRQRSPAAGVRGRELKAFDLTLRCRSRCRHLGVWDAGYLVGRVDQGYRVRRYGVAVPGRSGCVGPVSTTASGVVSPGGSAMATFADRTSRAGDPQLHRHCMVAERCAGRWESVALDAGPLHVWAEAAGSVFLNELERSLTDHLGVDWGPDRNGSRELTGSARTVPAVLRAHKDRSAAGGGRRSGFGSRRNGCEPMTMRR